VGNVLATELLIVTNEFLDITCPKKFACLCGVVPFDHSSGTSIKQRTHVSKMANIKMKTLLHMCAISTTCHDSELREYYKRRVNEGYPKMSAINAIRNKLIHRVFACVRENRPYQVPEIYKRFEPAPYAV
jgi:transposase